MSLYVADQRPPLRFLALGDSYTIGEAVPAEQRWPVQLVQRLRARGLDVAAPEIVARTGWTTDELATAITAAPLAPPYDLVSLLIGVNDQYRGRPLAQYEAGFAALLRTAVRFAAERPERVLVLSIPDWGVTPFARRSGRDPERIGAEIDAFNARAKSHAQAAGVHFLDITDLTREAARQPELLAEDGLHPSGLEYARWAARAEPIVRAGLARSTPSA